MLKRILSPDSCGKCRVCCGFDESDKWEIPLIFREDKERIESRFGCKLVPRENEYVFDMSFSGSELVFCPMVGEHGCVMGEDKPFDCRIWPFRVNDLDGKRVITVSPVCKTVSALPLSALTEFLETDGFKELLFSTAAKHPDMVKPYIRGYPILAVEEQK